MAVLTFPLSLANFFNGLPIRSVKADLGEALEFSETAGGEILTADIGARLWRVDVIMRPGDYAEMEAIKAKVNTLRYAGRSLLVHSMPLTGPQYDPTGTILGASNVRLTSVESNNRELTIYGLPVGYQLRPGDTFSFTYGSNPVRYAMHQVVTGGTANGSGVMSGIEVSSFIRSGWVANAVITLIKPVFKAVLMPGSFEQGESQGQFTTGVGFSMMQTLR